MKVLIALLMLISSSSFAGGFVVAGGKTHTAILIYEHLLNWEQRKQIYALIQNEFDHPGNSRLLFYESVTDLEGNPAMCAHFFSNISGTPLLKAFQEIATSAQVPQAVKPVGQCRQLDAIN